MVTRHSSALMEIMSAIRPVRLRPSSADQVSSAAG
jgi:hypothetical protein